MSSSSLLGTLSSEVGRSGDLVIERSLVQSQFVLYVVPEPEQNVPDVRISMRNQSHGFLDVHEGVFVSPTDKILSQVILCHKFVHRAVADEFRDPLTSSLLELLPWRSTLQTTSVSVSVLFPQTPRTRPLPGTDNGKIFVHTDINITDGILYIRFNAVYLFTHVQLSLATRSVQIKVDLQLFERRVQFVFGRKLVQSVRISVSGLLQSTFTVQRVTVFQQFVQQNQPANIVLAVSK